MKTRKELAIIRRMQKARAVYEKAWQKLQRGVTTMKRSLHEQKLAKQALLRCRREIRQRSRAAREHGRAVAPNDSRDPLL